MYESLVERLRCPVDLGVLSLDVATRGANDHVMNGRLHCAACQQVYPIKDGVPDLIPKETVQIGKSDLEQLQTATIDRFGFEWRHFRDWGWLTEFPDVPEAEERFYGGLVKHTQGAFRSKSLFQEGDLQSGHLVLDAGCGNGRFTNQAAETGAEIIGIDLGQGVNSAFEHMRSLPNVHIVQGDLIRLPFADATFDRVFSIGVLMHTGSASAAFDSLARTLRPDGLLVAHVYGRGWWIYELLDMRIRAITTRLPIEKQMGFARATAAVARWLRRGKRRRQFYRALFWLVNLLPTEIHMFDWWAAPIATHHTQQEVLSWFAKNHLEIMRANPPLGDPAAERSRCRGHAAITILGRRKTG